MHLQTTQIESTGQASAAIEQQLHRALVHGEHYALALLAGLLVARWMRARGLHWGWASMALSMVVLARALLGGAAPLLMLSAFGATLRGRRWHREDLYGGGDLRRIALDRSSPVAVLSAAFACRAPLVLPRFRVGRRLDPERLLLGRERSGRAVSVQFGAQAGRHTLVLGATGSGKTVTQTLIAVRAIERGMGVIVVDPKGDRGMRERLVRFAARAGRPFLEWTPNGPSVYNPYARGGDTEIADRVLAGERFTEPHYLRQAQRYLGHAVRALRAAEAELSLPVIVRHLEPQMLELLLRELPESESEDSHAYLDSLTPRQLRDLAGVRDRLAILTESDVGRWIDPSTERTNSIELLDSACCGAVVYFNLESDSRPLLSQMLGAAIVQDLQSTVAALQGSPVRTLVVIDEFSAIAAEQVVALFGRARSAGFSLVLGTQELSDLRPPGRERLLEQVMGNLSLLIAHRQVVPGSAELLARMAGNRGSWRVTWNSDGRTTRTRSVEPVLAPERLTTLAPGWAAVMALGAAEGARLVTIDSIGGQSQ
jgi:hypothetical protein